MPARQIPGLWVNPGVVHQVDQAGSGTMSGKKLVP